MTVPQLRKVGGGLMWISARAEWYIKMCTEISLLSRIKSIDQVILVNLQRVRKVVKELESRKTVRIVSGVESCFLFEG